MIKRALREPTTKTATTETEDYGGKRKKKQQKAKEKSFSSYQITDCDDIYHLYRQLLCEQANQKQIVVCYYLCITYSHIHGRAQYGIVVAHESSYAPYARTEIPNFSCYYTSLLSLTLIQASPKAHYIYIYISNERARHRPVLYLEYV